jgi:uncharacterized protein YkwD
MRRKTFLMLVTALFCFTTACGGSGDSGGGGGNPGGGGASMSAAELQLATDALTAINAHRAGHGLAPYTWHAASAQVAYTHSLDMDNRNFFAHVNPDGLDGSQRIAAAGITHDPGPGIIPANFAGENIAYGFNANNTGQIVVNNWIASPGHHTQIDAPQPVAGAQTMPAWTHCGIGVHWAGSEYWWTAVFLRNPVP